MRVIAALAALIGLITGVGTVVGWIASASLEDALSEALLIAGLSYGVLAIVGVIVMVLDTKRWWVRIFWGIALVFAAIGWTDAVVTWNEPRLRIFGVLGLFIAFGLGVGWGEARYDAYRASRKECPDCIETVHVRARVCKFCGHRFEVADAPTEID